MPKPKGKPISELEVEEVKAALATHKGVVIHAASEIGTSRFTLTRYIEKNPEVAEFHEQEIVKRERPKRVEGQIMGGKRGTKYLGKRKSELDYSYVRDTLFKQKGLLKQSAEALGCSRDVLNGYLKDNPSLREFADQQKEGVKDLLEETGWDLALGRRAPDWEETGKYTRKPDSRMLQALLKSYVQDRGYYDGPQFGQGNPNQVINISIGGALAKADEEIEVEAEVIPELEEAKSE